VSLVTAQRRINQSPGVWEVLLSAQWVQRCCLPCHGVGDVAGKGKGEGWAQCYDCLCTCLWACTSWGAQACRSAAAT
jgi:hypothetical protein